VRDADDIPRLLGDAAFQESLQDIGAATLPGDLEVHPLRLVWRMPLHAATAAAELQSGSRDRQMILSLLGLN